MRLTAFVAANGSRGGVLAPAVDCGEEMLSASLCDRRPLTGACFVGRSLAGADEGASVLLDITTERNAFFSYSDGGSADGTGEPVRESA